MPFANFDSEGKVNEASIQIVRIPEGTQLIIDAGKLHFVPVAEGPGEEKLWWYLLKWIHPGCLYVNL